MWVLEVRPGSEEEYRRRHDEIWPEMVETLKEVGIHNYSIFRHGLTLFGYFETHAIHKGWGKGPLRTLQRLALILTLIARSSLL